MLLRLGAGGWKNGVNDVAETEKQSTAFPIGAGEILPCLPNSAVNSYNH
jgi:hypothetical protein